MGGLTRVVPAQVGRSEAPPESGLSRVALAYEVTPLNQSFEQAGGGLPISHRDGEERHRTEGTEETEGVGDDVVRGQAGSPDSDGASPYLGRCFPHQPAL
jgi:hypothetical protein